jgi:hypothetical protein
MNLIEFLSKHIKQSFLKAKVQNLLFEATSRDFEKLTDCLANAFGSSIGELPVGENPELLRIRSSRFVFAINEMIAMQTDPEAIQFLEGLRIPTYDEYKGLIEGVASDNMSGLMAIKPDLAKYRGLTLNSNHAEGYLDLITQNYPGFIQNFFFWKTTGRHQREKQEVAHLYCRWHRIGKVRVHQVPFA